MRTSTKGKGRGGKKKEEKKGRAVTHQNLKGEEKNSIQLEDGKV